MEMENIDDTLTGSEQSTSRLGGRRDPTVDFLREQHALSLQGLHAEIEKLHKTCADLQFQLVFNGIKRSGSPLSSSSTSSSNFDDEQELGTSSSLTAQLSETRRTCHDLRATIEQLEHRIQQQEDRYQEDVGARNLIVARLRKEVQEKKNTISNLVKLLRVRPDRCQAGVNLNRDEILRRAEAQMGSIEPGPLLTVFSPKVGGRSSQSSSSSSSSSTSRATKSTATSMSHLGKQLVEKYCAGGGSRQMNAGTFPVTSSAEQARQNGNPPRRPDSLSGPLMPANADDTQMRPSSVSILEPWSPHQSNGRN